MGQDDRAYYERRARQERDRANQCEDNSAALVHLRLAEEYERRTQDQPVRLHVAAGS